MAQESDVTDFSDENFPKEIEVIPLPGHFFDMVGFRMPDNVVFLADCISSRETLDKYAVSFIYDVGAYLETLDKVEQMEAAMFVPAHADASADVKELVRYNRIRYRALQRGFYPSVKNQCALSGFLQEVFKGYGLSMNFEQYVLVGSTVRSLPFVAERYREKCRLNFRTVCCFGRKHNFMTRKQSGRHTGKARKI